VIVRCLALRGNARPKRIDTRLALRFHARLGGGAFMPLDAALLGEVFVDQVVKVFGSPHAAGLAAVGEPSPTTGAYGLCGVPAKNPFRSPVVRRVPGPLPNLAGCECGCRSLLPRGSAIRADGRCRGSFQEVAAVILLRMKHLAIAVGICGIGRGVCSFVGASRPHAGASRRCCLDASFRMRGG